MEAFGRGWNFLKQAWQMAMKDRDLLKPTIYNMLVGFVVSLIGILPMVGLYFLFGSLETTLSQIVFAIAGALMAFINYSITYLFSAMTIYLIYGYLSEGDGRMDKAWAIVKRDMWDILALAGASTLVNLLKNQIKGKGKSAGRNFLAGLIDTVWTEAAFLILPAMVIEDFNLKDGLKRAGMIIKNNLLLVGISTVGVKAVNGLIGFLFFGVALAVGLAVGYPIVSLTGVSTAGLITGIALGVLLFLVITMIGSVVTSYTSTAYHTCLYLWAREVEQARESGKQSAVAAPAPLAAVLPK